MAETLKVELDLPADPNNHGEPITALLHAWRRGESGAEKDLLQQVYFRLHRLAERALRGERADHTLQATALVHEAFLRLAGHALPDWQDRGHFFALTARMMRRILVDHARAQHAVRRGEGKALRVDLEDIADSLPASQNDPVDLIALDRALDRLAAYDARKARVVEFRCFLGFSVAETAALLGVSEPTVILDLRLARAWLSTRLSLADV
jgi:RNA polymerase sigma factor (TIGR02999 family)